MPNSGKNRMTDWGIGALTFASVGMGFTTWRALQYPGKIPLVDATMVEPPGGGKWPFVSVIVPARNEERNLPRLLPSILSQCYPNYEVIVVDDQSQDASPAILAEWARKESRLKVVRGKQLPRDDGWMGKPHAMHQGVQQARGEWLMFTDADTVHDPLSISSPFRNCTLRLFGRLTGLCAC